MLNFLKHLFQLLFSPGNGWEDISHQGRDAKRLAKEGLYPFLGITAISAFLNYFYNYDLNLINLLQDAIITFVQFFITYFIAIILFSVYLGKYVEGELNEKRNMTFITYSIVALAFAKIVENSMPTEMSIVQFLPVYVAIIMGKGSKYMAVKRKNLAYFIILTIVSIILPVYLIKYIFDFIL